METQELRPGASAAAPHTGRSSIPMETLLRVFQVCDSTFPIGTFNHSFGMENYLSRRVIRKAPAFRTWIKNYFSSQYRYGEGLLVTLCFRAMEDEAEEGGADAETALRENASGREDKKTNLPEDEAGAAGQKTDGAENGGQQESCSRRALRRMLTYDDVITKSTLAIETREGTKMIARQMYLLIRKMYGDTIPYLTEYAARVEAEKAFGNPAIVFSMFAHANGIPVRDAFEMYGYSVASTLVQNAVRAVPLGQREGQLILRDVIELIGSLYEKTASLSEGVLGANAPGLELAQIAHETQPARLFMS